MLSLLLSLLPEQPLTGGPGSAVLWVLTLFLWQGWTRLAAGVHGLHDQPGNGEREIQRGDRERFPRPQLRGEALRDQGGALPGKCWLFSSGRNTQDFCSQIKPSTNGLEAHVTGAESVLTLPGDPLQQTQKLCDSPTQLFSWLYRGRGKALGTKKLLRLNKTRAT